MNAIIESGVLESRHARSSGDTPLLEIRDLRIEYRGRYESVVAVPNVSLTIAPGKAMASSANRAVARPRLRWR